MSATARPWRASACDWRGKAHLHDWFIVGDVHDGEDGPTSTAVAVVIGNATSGTIPRENAELLVRAVNAHDDLVAACKAAERTLICAIEAGIDNPDVLAHALENHCTLTLLRAALAKTEVKA